MKTKKLTMKSTTVNEVLQAQCEIGGVTKNVGTHKLHFIGREETAPDCARGRKQVCSLSMSW